jgi:tetratricopeptide (TPR) repeat protein
MPLSESVKSVLFPITCESLCVEILSTPHSVCEPDYYTKVDIYAYSRDEDILFTLTPLSLRSDKVTITPAFFVKLSAFMNTYFDNEICKLNSKLMRDKRKYFHLAEFYFKHGFYNKAQFFSSKALQSNCLQNAEKAAIFENKIFMKILHSKDISRIDVLEVGRLYGLQTSTALAFIIEVGDFIDPNDFVFLMRQVDPNKLTYLQRVYFFYKCALIFQRQQKLRLAVFSYINAYFSIQDGYNMDFKVHLHLQALSLVKKDKWKQIIESVLDRVRNNEDENVQISIKKSISVDLSYNTEYRHTEHVEFFTLNITSFDNLVCFGNNDCVYAGSNLFEENVVYYLDYICLNIQCKESAIEIVQLCGYLLNKSHGMEEVLPMAVDVFKSLRPGNNIVNISCDEDFVVKEVKYRKNGEYVISSAKNIKLIRVQPIFTHKIVRLGFDAGRNFSLMVKTGSNTHKNPKILCVGVEGDVTFDSEGLCSIHIPQTQSPRERIEILCEVTSGVYKKYVLPISVDG